MGIWSDLGGKLSGVAARSAHVVKRVSPELLIGGGVVALVAAGVMAAIKGKRGAQIVDQAAHNFNDIKEAQDRELPNYSDEDALKDKVETTVTAVKDLAVAFGPSILLGVVGVSSILTGAGILKGRLATMATIASTTERFLNDYRARVREHVGADKERALYHNLETGKITVKGEDGKKTKVVTYDDPGDDVTLSQYARMFEELNPNWSKSHDLNLLFLRAQQNYFNDRLQRHGFVFLNEVYEALGLRRTSEGALVGWLHPNAAGLTARQRNAGRPEGDGVIDFGVFDGRTQSAKDFLSGWENTVLLDFNVDGVIYDLI